MPQPHLSAVLNNCGLHALTPELRDQITNSPDSFLNAYDRLKEKFESFYGFDSMRTIDFQMLLNAYNPFDLQIILGPVLRLMMADYMRENSEVTSLYRMADERFENNVDNEAFISEKTSIQDNGRYGSLSPDELFTFLAEPLGLSIVYHFNGVERVFPENIEQLVQFQNRPQFHIYHEGGSSGAEAGGHWERTNNQADRVFYESESDTYLLLLSDLFKNDTRELTEIGLSLLKQHLQLMGHQIFNNQSMDSEFADFNLTLAQIEKFIYNRLYVDKTRAIKLLGQLTPKAQEIIDSMSDQGVEYVEIVELIDANLPEIARKNPIKPHYEYSSLHYQIALTLLTPPVSQRQGHSQKENIWELRANEISALAYVETILFNEGLSNKLYEVCNQSHIANALTSNFLSVISEDEFFSKKASALLKECVRAMETAHSSVFHEVSSSSNIWDKDSLDLSRVEKNSDASDSFSICSTASSLDLDLDVDEQKTMTQKPRSTINTHFYLQSMQFFLCAGGVSAMIALLTCSSVAAMLGITLVCGVPALSVSIVSGGVAMASLLTGLSLFMGRHIVLSEPRLPQNNPLLSPQV